jgi:hypothetical protein
MYFAIFTFTLILLIVIILIKNSKLKKNYIFEKNSIDKKNTNQNSIDLSNIKIPYKIKEIMDFYRLIESTTELYKVFKSLSYQTKKEEELLAIEWNNLEISQFLYLLQSNRNIMMQDPKELFHCSILSFSKEQLNNEMKFIILKYNKYIVNNEISSLREQVIWSAKEVSIILYYLSLTKKLK